MCCGLNPEWTLELHVCVEPVPSANIYGLNAFFLSGHKEIKINASLKMKIKKKERGKNQSHNQNEK